MDKYNLDVHKVALTPCIDTNERVKKFPPRLHTITSSAGLSAALKFKNHVTSEDLGWSQVSHFAEAFGIPDNDDDAKSKRTTNERRLKRLQSTPHFQM